MQYPGFGQRVAGGGQGGPAQGREGVNFQVQAQLDAQGDMAQGREAKSHARLGVELVHIGKVGRRAAKQRTGSRQRAPMFRQHHHVANLHSQQGLAAMHHGARHATKKRGVLVITPDGHAPHRCMLVFPVPALGRHVIQKRLLEQVQQPLLVGLTGPAGGELQRPVRRQCQRGRRRVIGGGRPVGLDQPGIRAPRMGQRHHALLHVRLLDRQGRELFGRAVNVQAALAKQVGVHAVAPLEHGNCRKTDSGGAAPCGIALERDAIDPGAGARQNPAVGRVERDRCIGRWQARVRFKADGDVNVAAPGHGLQAGAMYAVAGQIEGPDAGMARRCHHRHGRLAGVGRRRWRGKQVQMLLIRSGHFGRNPDHSDLAVVQPEGAGTERFDLVHRVRAEKNGCAAVTQTQNAVEGLAGKLAVAHRQGFVNHQDVGFDAGGQRKRQSHEHAGGVGFNRAVNEHANAGKSDDLVQPLGQLLAAQTHQRAVQQQVLAAGELGVKTCPQFEQRSNAAGHPHLPHTGRQRATEDLQQCGFAGTIGPHQADDLTALDLEIHRMKRPERGRLADGAAQRRHQRSARACRRIVGLAKPGRLDNETFVPA